MTKTTKRERPIICGDIMVRAILDGRKSQTRRVVKSAHLRSESPISHILSKIRLTHALSYCPYGQVGDLLSVRETWGDADIMYQAHTNDIPFVVAYRADLSAYRMSDPPKRVPKYDTDQWNWEALRWRSPIHMPSWYSRLILTVTDIRLERLQDISDSDCMAEGIVELGSLGLYGYEYTGTPRVHVGDSPRYAYQFLWDFINGKQCSWETNPYVWAIDFVVKK